MDQLLWTFRDGSFVPHDIIQSGAPDPDAPVTIGIGSPEMNKPDLLINLTESIPEDLGSFARVAEIVTSDEQCKTRSRRHYAAYREAGHTMDTHKL
jgi:DNA polymerase-3 subunit chi